MAPQDRLLLESLTTRLARLEDRVTRIEAHPPPPHTADPAPLTRPEVGPRPACVPAERLVAEALGSLANSARRLADHFTPRPQDVVGTPYVARALACTATWVSEMARDGCIPRHCVVAGTGNGKPWKFHKAKIDDWLKPR
jgi:hypothetical protein